MSDVQQKAYGVVAESPGLTITGLAKHLGCSHSTATHHLNTLASLRIVVRERDGRTVRHYVPHHSRDTTVRLQALVNQDRYADLIRLLASHQHTEALSINKLAKQLGVPFNSLKVILCNLEAEGLIEMERRKGRYRIRRRLAFERAVRVLEEQDAEVEIREGPAAPTTELEEKELTA